MNEETENIGTEDYRNLLIKLEQQAQESLDRWILTLSGGALGVTFVFIKDVLKADTPVYQWSIGFAWACWGLSITVVLASFLSSHLALRKALTQFDNGSRERLGGHYDCLTNLLNILGLFLFFVGVMCAIFFVCNNY